MRDHIICLNGKIRKISLIYPQILVLSRVKGHFSNFALRGQESIKVLYESILIFFMRECEVLH